MTNILIYGLIDPETRQLRYVGVSKDLKKRLMAHMCPSSLKPTTHKNAWIKSLKSKNLCKTGSLCVGEKV